ncbi:hypothetical protein DP939_22700 [Spongiactinospora rosea]|uniref:Uncharacterized protein n=1 Tax=Spongiactinospora rosea TaxID=2248750 RepID=A0A366LUP9_9ACTN|nr:hypothetical protein [Spongiactinospora rosea]RBQ17686.1 hypothetical protein DP939_22700 [Spongiactinospora rosea]
MSGGSCPDCGGSGEDRTLPGYVLRCGRCSGRGVDHLLGNAPAAPAEPPPVWEDRCWSDPRLAGISCRICLDQRYVANVRGGVLATLPCPACTPGD